MERSGGLLGRNVILDAFLKGLSRLVGAAFGGLLGAPGAILTPKGTLDGETVTQKASPMTEMRKSEIIKKTLVFPFQIV